MAGLYALTTRDLPRSRWGTENSNDLYEYPIQFQIMARDPFGAEETPGIQTILDALEDADCRAILEHLEEPMTAQEISDVSSIPLSTTYRKLDVLSEASLVDEITEIRGDGHHTTRYTVDFQSLNIALHDQEFDVEIERPARSADEQLAHLWSEVRKET